MDGQKESLLALVSAVGEIDEASSLKAAESLASQGMGPRDIQKALELGMRIVADMYRRGEYFIADRLHASRLYARIMDMPQMRSPRSGTAPIPTVILGSLPGDIHDAGNDAAEAALRAYGFPVRYLGLGAHAESFERAAKELAPCIVAISCARSQAADELSALTGRIRKAVPQLVNLIVRGDEALAPSYKKLGADAYAEDVLALLDLCIARSGELSP